MNYQQTVEWLYNATPMFQRVGAAAYKPGLDTAIQLANAFGNPHLRFPSIHVAGTNGKGSTCHTLASVLQSAGYKVGLYTSPHLIDFRERIRVNGEKISEQGVVDFVSRWQRRATSEEILSQLTPSFFEFTTIMAFDWFASQGVDIAVIETGLGGRLDTTNIITPILSVITNISLDHTAQLGSTLEEIATEKAGIIKDGIPVVIGNNSGKGVKEVFECKAQEKGAPLLYAPERNLIALSARTSTGWLYRDTPWGDIVGELAGDCQCENAATVFTALKCLTEMGWNIPSAAVARGFARVTSLTGLMGRWMKISDSPTLICDTGHNQGGWEYLSQRLNNIVEETAGSNNNLRMIIGFVNDKDVSHILKLMPEKGVYYFTQASVPRAMQSTQLQELALQAGLHGNSYASVSGALSQAKKDAASGDIIFVGGSTFVVADLLSIDK